MKKIFSGILVLTLLLSSGTAVFAEDKPASTSKNNIGTRAWPGRPGGNGDGSEEWLQGSYGQTSGPYKLLYSSKGTTNSLNTQKAVSDGIGLGILGLLMGEVYVGVTAARLSEIGLTALGIANTIWGGYEGAYYKSNTYISGRCMKTVITTYKNSNYTGQVKVYTKYTKW